MAIDKDFRKLAVKVLDAPIAVGPRGHKVREAGPQTVSFITPPLPSARRASVHIAQQELAWMLGGSGSEEGSRNGQVTSEVENIWRPWDPDGTQGLGPVYGVQWRKWVTRDGGLQDQINGLLEGLRADPLSRRHVLTMWRPDELQDMALPPCPIMHVFTMYRGRLWLTVLARSTDIVCGLPVDLLEAYMFLRMTGAATGLLPGGVTFHSANMHLYHGHEPIMERYLDPPGFDVDPSLRCIKLKEIKAAGDLSPVTGREWKVTDYHAPIIHADVIV